MNKKIILSVLAAIVLFGTPAFVSSPYMALVFLDLDGYYILKANRLAVHECSELYGSDDTAFDICFPGSHRKFVALLKK